MWVVYGGLVLIIPSYSWSSITNHLIYFVEGALVGGGDGTASIASLGNHGNSITEGDAINLMIEPNALLVIELPPASEDDIYVVKKKIRLITRLDTMISLCQGTTLVTWKRSYWWLFLKEASL